MAIIRLSNCVRDYKGQTKCCCWLLSKKKTSTDKYHVRCVAHFDFLSAHKTQNNDGRCTHTWWCIRLSNWIYINAQSFIVLLCRCFPCGMWMEVKWSEINRPCKSFSFRMRKMLCDWKSPKYVYLLYMTKTKKKTKKKLSIKSYLAAVNNHCGCTGKRSYGNANFVCRNSTSMASHELFKIYIIRFYERICD